MRCETKSFWVKLNNGNSFRGRMLLQPLSWGQQLARAAERSFMNLAAVKVKEESVKRHRSPI